MEGKNVAVTFMEDGQPQALLTCGRDLESLKTEAGWEGIMDTATLPRRSHPMTRPTLFFLHALGG